MEGKRKGKGQEKGEERFCFNTERFKMSILFWIGRKQRYV